MYEVQTKFIGYGLGKLLRSKFPSLSSIYARQIISPVRIFFLRLFFLFFFFFSRDTSLIHIIPGDATNDVKSIVPPFFSPHSFVRISRARYARMLSRYDETNNRHTG